MNDLTCILNGTSGSRPNPETSERLTRLFADHGASARILVASHGSEITRLARQAAKEKVETVVAGGGDGTVNAVATELVGTASQLGVLPLGTLNHFAKDLRIPMGLPEAVKCIVAGRVVNVDVGEVNGRIFLNNSSLGIYPRIVRQREEEQKVGRGKWWAFARAVISVFTRYSQLRVHLQMNQQDLVRDTPFVFIGNNQYQMEGFNIGERFRLDEGNLCVYVANRCERTCLVRLALQALLGRLKNARDLDSMSVPDLLVHTKRRRISVATDGEVTFMTTPLKYHMRPAALRVIVPPAEGTMGEERLQSAVETSRA